MKKIIMLVLITALLPLTGCGATTANPSGELTVGLETENPSASGELTIAAFIPNEFLLSAARKYEEANEGVTVNITFYAGEERDVSKYSQIINTALMSGRGEDIIDVSSLTWTKLADKDRLVDLNNLLSFDSEAYYMNILDAFLYRDMRYTIPLSFMFEAFEFYDDFTGIKPQSDFTVNDLLALAGRHPGTPLFDGSGFGMGQTTFAYKLFSLNSSDFLGIEQKETNVDNAEFISILEKVDSLREQLIGFPAILKQSLVYSAAMTNNGTEDLSNMFHLTNEAGQALFEPSGFMPAINANSENQELAADFIQFLLSEEMMTSPELWTTPVNKKAAAEKARLTFESVKAGGWWPEGLDQQSFDIAWLERNFDEYNMLVERLSIVESADHFIRDFVTTEMGRYFQGEQSAEQAARNLQSRLNTYLQE